MTGSDWLVELAVEPTRLVREHVETTLSHVCQQLNLRFLVKKESELMVVGAQSEDQLRCAIACLKAVVPEGYNVGAPQVAYRESLAKAVELTYTHKKQSGGSGQFGEVRVQLEPGERGSGIEFLDEIKGGNIPREYIPSVEKGMRETAETGSLIGFPIIDFKIRLTDGKYHDVDSSALAFEITGRGAMREAAQKAGIKLLEPIMKVEVVTPEDYLGDVIGDLNSRRGQIQGTDSRGNAQVVEALVPLANMFGYVNELRSFSQGRAQYTMQFSHYEEVPQNVADEVKAKLA
jgi:elongation factor G